VRREEEVIGIPIKTLYKWKDKPGNGLRAYKVGGLG